MAAVAKCGLWDGFRDDSLFLYEQLSQIVGFLSVDPDLELFAQALDLERVCSLLLWLYCPCCVLPLHIGYFTTGGALP